MHRREVCCCAGRCDLIVAADNAKFSDPVVRMGIGGVEYHAHTWEVGPRKAKEWLFTASSFTAAEAEKLGMVNRVVPLDELRTNVMALAGDIAQMHPFALAQAKRAVNQTMDVQGFYAALQSVFDIHQTGHGNALVVNGYPILVDLDQMKQSHQELRSGTLRANEMKPLGQLLDEAVARTPDAVALRMDERVWTYREFDSLVERVASGLADAGVRARRAGGAERGEQPGVRRRRVWRRCGSGRRSSW